MLGFRPSSFQPIGRVSAQSDGLQQRQAKISVVSIGIATWTHPLYLIARTWHKQPVGILVLPSTATDDLKLRAYQSRQSSCINST